MTLLMRLISILAIIFLFPIFIWVVSDLLTFTPSSDYTVASDYIPNFQSKWPVKVPSPVYNETLGFGRLYCINLPRRTDRKDAMQLMALATDISLKFISAIDGKDIDTKALIGHPDRKLDSEDTPEGFWGCWRSHLNALNDFLDSGLETALILEDDIDWDVHLKDNLSKASKAIKEMELERHADLRHAEHRPYGSTWDIIYLGSCFEGSPDDYKKWPHRVYPDPSVPEKSKISGSFFSIIEGFSNNPDGMRLIMQARGPVCSFGYAITRLGAIKLVYYLGTEPLRTALDVHMSILIRGGGLKGYTAVPPIFAPWRSGQQGRDSDLREDVGTGNYDIKDGIRAYLGEWLEKQNP